jgi:hypothetical protein
VAQSRNIDNPSGSGTFDALVIGAAYGELTPAEQSRLAAHLEAHPNDRAAIDQLQAIRNAVRDSAVRDAMIEPPQAVSALLLQEAARRVPKRASVDRNPGWFAKLLGSFAAHPALASAASLVFVVGVAGTLYIRSGGDSLSAGGSSVRESAMGQALSASESRRVQTEEAPSEAAPESVVEPASSDDGVRAGLADSVARPAGGAGDKARSDDRRADLSLSEKQPAKTKRAAPAKPFASPVPRPAQPAAEPVATKFDQARAGKKAADRSEVEAAFGVDSKDSASEAVAPGAPAGDEAPRGRAFATAPPPSVAQAAAPSVAEAAAPMPAKGTSLGASGSEDYAPKREASSWVRGTHQRLIAMVRAGKCAEAGPLVAQLKSRASDYYSTHVANDRSLGSCLSYLAKASPRDHAAGSASGEAKAGKKAGAAAAAEAAQ